MTHQTNLSQAEIGEFVQAAHFDLGKVEALLEQYPELVHLRWETFDELAIEAAGHMGRREIALTLLEHGAPLQAFTAAMLGWTDAVEDFLRREPELVNARGVHGFSLYFHATLSGKLELLDLLARYGGTEGLDQALHAAVHLRSSELVDWLLQHGVEDVNLPDYQGKTPLQVATERGDGEIVQLLQAYGAEMPVEE